MAKRKAKEADLDESKDEPRRSSRRTVTAVKEEVKPELNGTSTASTPVKKGAGKKTKVVEKAISDDEDVSQQEKKVVKKVGLRLFTALMISIISNKSLEAIQVSQTSKTA